MKIIIIGREELLRQEANLIMCSTGLIIEVEEEMDTNYLGHPLFNSVFYRTLAADTEVAVFLNADTLILGDFIAAINLAHQSFSSWTAVALRWDIDDPSNRLQQEMTLESEASLRTWVTSKGTLHTYGGVDAWAYSIDKQPLVNIHIPPFVMGRARADNWLRHHMIHSSNRTLLDLTEAVTLIHALHNTKNPLPVATTTRRLTSTKKQPPPYETFINHYLSLHYGTYQLQLGTALHVPLKMTKCLVGPDHTEINCITRRVRPGVCPCEYSAFSLATNTDPHISKEKHLVLCGKLSASSKRDLNLSSTLHPSFPATTPGVPHTLQQLLPFVAINNTVILTAATFINRNMLLSFACNLKKLGIFNLLVAALDVNIYSTLYLAGLPVYYEDVARLLDNSESQFKENLISGGCDTYKSKCFSVLKAHIVIKILKLGYAVIWSDSDIALFRNPLPYLINMANDLYSMDNTQGLMIVHSNEPNASPPANGFLHINSGFYYLRPTSKTIESMEDVLHHASHSNATEQHSFYMVFCGDQMQYAVGTDECFNEGMRVKLLDRELFPNGGYKNMWTSKNDKAEYPERYLLQINRINLDGKNYQGPEEQGFYFHNKGYDICDWSWTKRLVKQEPLGKVI